MFNARFFAVFALFTFAATAAASWYMQQSDIPAPSAEQTSPDALPSLGGEPDALGQHAAELPVAVRPKPISPEELVQLGENLRKREETLGRRGRELDAERSRLMLSMEDIRREQQELESLQTKIQSIITTAEQLLSDLTEQQEQARQEQAKALEEMQARKVSEKEMTDTERSNIRRMAAWFQEMEPEKAAEYLRGLANNGDLDTAVRLLADFEERDAANILAALDDYELVAQLTEKFKSLKPPEKKSALR